MQPENNVRIRPAGSEDADEIFRMATLLATSAVPQRDPFLRSLTMIVEDHRQYLIVADAESGLVGYLHGLVHPAFHANGDIGWIEELFVDSRARRTGLGRRLMQDFEQWSRHNDVQYIAVATRRASDFYTAIGYTESATYFKKVL